MNDLDMNDEFELHKRLKNADPAKSAPSLNEGVVAKAALTKRRGLTSFRTARLTMAAASLSIVGLAATTLSLNLGPNNAPLFEMAAAGSNQAEASSLRAGSSPMTSDKMFWQPFTYNHVAGELSGAPGRGKVYQSELVGDPIAILNRLARVFDITGQPKLDEWSSPEFPSYSIQDGNRSLGLYFSGTGSWYYSSWTDFDYSCPGVEGEAVNSDEGAEKLDEPQFCQPKSTPELIPTELEMIAQAVMIFGAIDISLEGSQARAYSDEWGSSISFPNVQNGLDTGQDYYLGWGMDGNLSYASGSSFRLIERGDFETISAIQAVTRIADGRWFGAAPSSAYQNAVATSEPMVLPTTRDAVKGDESINLEEQIEPAPQIVDLLVNRAEAATLTVYDAAGNLWFVPGYLLFNDQGWFDAIISLQEGVITLPERVDFGIMPYLPEPAVD